MDTFITLLDLEPSSTSFVGSSLHSAPQLNHCGELAEQHIEPSDSLPVDQDRHNIVNLYCVIL
ncbi:hypothetical protein CY34DRAFT_809554 [Suillus luteus UH-Slu-Lm8-n1]|uniref:Pheromone n=1 Tax=Suillus luteus UH-Slu-Lm8-n1 TaxID=930992 RepID=A0A0D0A930_9AGAM|nr:hypothetical protein CY34DRAFT_809554 [Suillus luteus UH-Slu-Lm8-n1]